MFKSFYLTCSDYFENKRKFCKVRKYEVCGNERENYNRNYVYFILRSGATDVQCLTT